MPIDAFLNQTATRKPKTGRDGYGKATFGTAETVECRFQQGTFRLTNKDGMEYQADAKMHVKPSQAFNVDDLVTFESVDYRVDRADEKRDVAGIKHHKKLYLVRTASQ